MVVSWCAISMYFMKSGDMLAGWHWLAGVMLIIAVELFAFMLWSVFCWGYTLSMLLCLSKSKSARNLFEWQNFYTGSVGTKQLTLDRAQVLVWIKCAKIDGENLILTRFGHAVSLVFKKISQYAGVKQ